MKKAQKVEYPRGTNAIDVIVKCLIDPRLVRRDIHCTVDGFRAVVDYEDQSYEILVKPLYRYIPTPKGVCNTCKGNQRVHDYGIWTKPCPTCNGTGKSEEKNG